MVVSEFSGWKSRAALRAGLIVAGLGLMVAALVTQAPRAVAQEIPAEFADLTIADEIYAPVSLGVAPDGRIIIMTDSGQALMIKDDVLLDEPVFDLRGSVATSGSQGLQSIAFDNNFDQNGHIYVTYTYDTSGDVRDGLGTNRLVRFTMNGDVATDETLLFDHFPV